MAEFAELRALIGHLPDDPLGDFDLPCEFLRIEATDLVGEIHHDGPDSKTLIGAPPPAGA